MERVTLLHIGGGVDAATVRQLCPLLKAPPAGAEVAGAPHVVVGGRALPSEAERIRQVLAQTGGNVTRAARLLGVSRDTVLYHMQCRGISRPLPGAPSPACLLACPRRGLKPARLRATGFLRNHTPTVRQQKDGPPALAMPDTIQFRLAARMDRFPPGERQLLQAASVLGKDLEVPLLVAIAELPEAAWM